MYRVSTNIPKEKFEKMISGNKNYVPSETLRALKENKKSNVLYKKSVGKDEALDILRYLAEKGLIPLTRSPYKIVQAAIREQKKEGQKKKDEKKTRPEKQKQTKEEKTPPKGISPRRARVYIAMERGDELAAEERGESKIRYDRRSPSNQLLEKLDREKAARDNKGGTKTENDKDGEYQIRKDGWKRKPKLIDTSKLDDMDIG